jgi:hypothetical protein
MPLRPAPEGPTGPRSESVLKSTPA